MRDRPRAAGRAIARASPIADTAATYQWTGRIL
jgi:hypothetical protein